MTPACFVRQEAKQVLLGQGTGMCSELQRQMLFFFFSSQHFCTLCCTILPPPPAPAPLTTAPSSKLLDKSLFAKQPDAAGAWANAEDRSLFRER